MGETVGTTPTWGNPLVHQQRPWRVTANASQPAIRSTQSRAALPIANAAVAYASTVVSRWPTSVTLASSVAGRPVLGSMMWLPRSAFPMSRRRDHRRR